MIEHIISTLIISLLSAAGAYFFGVYKATATVKNGVQAILRYDMLTAYSKFRTSGCTIEEKQSFENMYNCYHKLGKNGVMTAFYEKVMAMEVNDEK
jgi:hypothetical protein